MNCQKCGKAIEPERLKVLPDTTTCAACAKKAAGPRAIRYAVNNDLPFAVDRRQRAEETARQARLDAMTPNEQVAFCAQRAAADRPRTLYAKLGWGVGSPIQQREIIEDRREELRPYGS